MEGRGQLERVEDLENLLDVDPEVLCIAELGAKVLELGFDRRELRNVALEKGGEDEPVAKLFIKVGQSDCLFVRLLIALLHPIQQQRLMMGVQIPGLILLCVFRGDIRVPVQSRDGREVSLYYPAQVEDLQDLIKKQHPRDQ